MAPHKIPPAAARAAQARFVVLTGLSGAGKSQAIRALEDLGFFCVDNLPTMLIPTMAELASRAGSGLENVAIVADVREGSFLAQFPRVFRRIRRMPGLKPILIFLEARDATLVRRFSETRRPHPLAKNRPVLDGIREERKALRPIRAMADVIIETSDLTVYDLRDAFMAHLVRVSSSGIAGDRMIGRQRGQIATARVRAASTAGQPAGGFASCRAVSAASFARVSASRRARRSR
jgi:UPF0042 nucleotide-binding protein